MPVVLVRERVFYKYVVRKAREQKQKDIYLWEQIDNIPYKNRCLTIPKGRCQAGSKLFLIFGEDKIVCGKPRLS